MNIFVLDASIKKCAENHCDQHSTKMVLETAQMISTVLRQCKIDYGYKQFNAAHPCNKWAATSLSNFLWLKQLGQELGREMYMRYGTTHRSLAVINQAPDPPIDDLGLTPFAQAMPDEYKNPDAIQAYREFYRKDKFAKGIIRYTNRQPPEWLRMKFDVVRKNNNVIYRAIGYAEQNEYNWK